MFTAQYTSQHMIYTLLWAHIFVLYRQDCLLYLCYTERQNRNSNDFASQAHWNSVTFRCGAAGDCRDTVTGGCADVHWCVSLTGRCSTGYLTVLFAWLVCARLGFVQVTCVVAFGRVEDVLEHGHRLTNLRVLAAVILSQIGTMSSTALHGSLYNVGVLVYIGEVGRPKQMETWLFPDRNDNSTYTHR